MTLAEKVAHLFAKRRGLIPPVDVRQVLQTFADVEEDRIPLDVDAVFLGKSKQRSRPLVILQRDRPPKRKTFTLGHELGHAVIPWHAGTFFCHVDFNAKLDDSVTREVETEANRFASQLMTPSNWVKQIADSNGTLSSKLKLVQVSGLSALSCSFSLIKHLPPGCFFTEVDETDMVRYSAGSPDSPISPPRVGTRIDRQFEKLCEPREAISGTMGTIYWWKMAPDAPGTETLVRPSKEILDEIFDDINLNAKAMQAARWSINGVIGVANSKFRKAPKTNFVALMKGRFFDRPQLARITSHRLFEEYLHARAAELRHSR
jgi:hypothetical protein